MKNKGERESYIQLNAEFQRIARRDKKAFFNEQSLIIEENNKRGKTRNLFRKIGNIKGTFYPKMSTIKDKNGRVLVDAEEIKKRSKEYMEKKKKEQKNTWKNCIKKILMNQINMMILLVTQSQTLECEVMWALRSTSLIKLVDVMKLQQNYSNP